MNLVLMLCLFGRCADSLMLFAYQAESRIMRENGIRFSQMLPQSTLLLVAFVLFTGSVITYGAVGATAAGVALLLSVAVRFAKWPRSRPIVAVAHALMVVAVARLVVFIVYQT
ncbi:hypothetical protein [Xanthomonas arboricola]|uniref:Uncharacterized protein n=4 Tax=Xanthomonas arboricola pv. pruni TaxID=69929 RepID=A0AAP4NI98_9XANT|nr:hypothetical protein [Xanthomonas arboricola]KCX00353.1 hypothetical protein DK27_18745 [Xanthomonas arboricola pv. pruni]KPN11110.1 hypothetical protein AN652_07605 [Xanthomonas arboricola pv. pruni]MDN0271344.1 hypothetical protein [Xanthomonas arboricola pv. pruni]MDN0275314.1 hypothetical protein [Xanthomonas arboricola pv. pruni]MDN0287984.1 hypothetical protein [Xanthomonas arboricola pv. pruni]